MASSASLHLLSPHFVTPTRASVLTEESTGDSSGVSESTMHSSSTPTQQEETRKAAEAIAVYRGSVPILTYTEVPAGFKSSHEFIAAFIKDLEKGQKQIYYTSPTPPSPPCPEPGSGAFSSNFVERDGISSYTEICAHMRSIFPSLMGALRVAPAGEFYMRARTVLSIETRRLDPKYKCFIELLEKTYAEAITLAPRQIAEKTQADKEYTRLGTQLAIVFKGSEGLQADLDLCRHLIEQCSAPDFLRKSREQRKESSSSMVVEYPDIFEPTKPVVISKTDPLWKENCDLIERVYVHYIELLDLHIHYIQQVMRQYLRLGKLLGERATLF